MSLTYKVLSNFYDLIDVLYFTKKGINPREALIKAIPDLPVNILDMCTGTASNSLSIAKSRRHAKIVGIDISFDMLKIAKDKIHEGNFNHIEVLQADASATPFADNSFDIVVLALVLHEIDADLAKKILKEAYRVLKKTGYLLVLEWEQPKKFIEKIKFAPIKLLEPRPFKTFFSCNKNEYFLLHNFQIVDEKHCDYSCVYKMQKVLVP